MIQIPWLKMYLLIFHKEKKKQQKRLKFQNQSYTK